MDMDLIRNDSAFKVHHIGIVVEDMDKAVAHYESMGIKPFVSMKPSPHEGRLRGKTCTSTPVISMCSVGGISIELLQPTEEESLAKEFYESEGEGVHHIAFQVSDMDKAAEQFVRNGFEILFLQKIGKGGCVYIDTSKIGGTLIELFCPSE
jgi:4-hydroxyphenylpyruvate dioxygenase-like putative hemolysin